MPHEGIVKPPPSVAFHGPKLREEARPTALLDPRHSFPKTSRGGPRQPAHQPSQEGEEPPSVLVVEKGRHPGHATRHHVVEGARELDPRRSHLRNLPRPSERVKITKTYTRSAPLCRGRSAYIPSRSGPHTTTARIQRTPIPSQHRPESSAERMLKLMPPQRAICWRSSPLESAHRDPAPLCDHVLAQATGACAVHCGSATCVQQWASQSPRAIVGSTSKATRARLSSWLRIRFHSLLSLMSATLLQLPKLSALLS